MSRVTAVFLVGYLAGGASLWAVKAHGWLPWLGGFAFVFAMRALADRLGSARLGAETQS